MVESLLHLIKCCIFDSSIKRKAMKNLIIILATIENLEAKRDNFTITFEESAKLFRLIELAESLVK